MIIKYLVFSVDDCGHQMDEFNEMLLFITRMKKFILIRGIFITSLITFVQKWNMTELGIV